MKSLKEVSDMVDLSRREIQEFERNKLAKKPSTRNKYGYLLYDTPEIERLWQLKFYKELGYNIPDIKQMSGGGELEEEELDKLIHGLKNKKDKLENIIVIAEGMKKYGVSFNLLRKKMSFFDEPSGENVLALMAAVIGPLINTDYEKWIDENMIPADDDSEELLLIIEAILNKAGTDDDVHDIGVQNMVDKLFGWSSNMLSESVFVFWEVFYQMALYPETRDFIDGDWGEGATDFFIDAIRYYCDQHMDNDFDKKFDDAIDNIQALALSRHKASCEEVQNEIENIHMFFKSFRVLKEGGDIMALKNCAEIFGSQAYKNMIDNGADRGLSWFFSRAIEIYLDNLKVSA